MRREKRGSPLGFAGSVSPDRPGRLKAPFSDWPRLNPGSNPEIAQRASRRRQVNGKLQVNERFNMVALIAFVLILATVGGLGLAVPVLWYVLILALLLWLIGVLEGGVADRGGRRWYGPC